MRIHPTRQAIMLVALLSATLLTACFPPPSTTPPIAVLDVWARPAQAALGAAAAGGDQAPQGMAEGQVPQPSGANSAIYLKLSNRGPAADRLVAAEAPVAQAVEVHETRMEGDVMTMQQVTGGIEIPAGGQVELKPGGYHIMLIGLTRDLKAGDRIPVTLVFASAPPLTVQAEVRQP